MTKIDFAKIIKPLSKLIPRFAPKFDDAETLDLWYDAFKEFDFRKFAETCVALRNHCEEFPSIKEIRDMYQACGGKLPQKKQMQLASDEEMEKIMKQLGVSDGKK